VVGGRTSHPKDEIDFLNEATAVIAGSHPDDFLDVFEDRKFDRNPFVLTGLGQIDDQRATNRLVAAAMSGGTFTRMYAAIGLGRRPAENAIGACLRSSTIVRTWSDPTPSAASVRLAMLKPWVRSRRSGMTRQRAKRRRPIVRSV
jgi:hypothetical protein